MIEYLQVMLFCYLSPWPYDLTDLLSLRLVGAVGARINVKCSHSQRGPSWPEFEPRFSRLQAQRL